jgi:hypothetical protein
VSDDEIQPAAVEDDDEVFTDADLDAELDAEEAAAAEARPGAGKLLLGLLAAVLVAVVGIVAWASIYAVRERE